MNDIKAPEKLKVLILDNVKALVEEHIRALEAAGFEVHFSNDFKKSLGLAVEIQPAIIITNLILEGQSTLSLIQEFSKRFEDKRCKIIVVTRQKSIANIREAVKSGAHDFLIEPVPTKLLLERLKYHLQDRETYRTEDIEKYDPHDLKKAFNLVFQCANILSDKAQTHEAVFNCLKKMADFSKSTRINIIQADLESGEAAVVASSDNPEINFLQVDINKYPEVQEVLLNGSIVFIKDITQNPLTKNLQEQVKSIKMQSLLVFPVKHRGKIMGTMSIRLEQANIDISEDQLKTYYIITLFLGPKIAAKKLMRSMNK